MRWCSAAQLEAARVELSASVDHCQELKETWLEIREARLQGMAAEIALDLAVGACCPVCGSAEHPQKAVPETGAPSAASEKAARSALDDAELARVAHDARVRDLVTSLSVAEARAGDDAATTGHACAPPWTPCAPSGPPSPAGPRSRTSWPPA